MLKILGFLAGVIAATAITHVAVADNPTPTPTSTPVPAANLHYRKIAGQPIDIGGSVRFQIDISNTGNADSSSQTVQDVLPGNIPWYIESDSWGCSLTPPDPVLRQILTCNAKVVPAQSKDGIPGYIQVTIVGQAILCGNYLNFANFNGSPLGIPAVAVVNCPATPTPTPTSSPMATSTIPAPTATPTATATHTPAPIITIIPKIAPGPPSTGNSPDYTDHTSYWYITVVAIFFSLGIIGMIFTMKGSRNA